jgi:hypothetical protein
MDAGGSEKTKTADEVGPGACTPEGDDQEAFIKAVTVVKRSLPSVIRLSGAARRKFDAFVEDQVRLTSLRMRRGSLVLLHHLTRLAKEGRRIPNLFAAKLTFWKDALRGDIADACAKGHLGEISDFVGPDPVHDRRGYDAVAGADDQILAYAAITFSTIVCNNTWVPLIPRLTRLAGRLSKSQPVSQRVKTFKLVAAIRQAGFDAVAAGFPQWAVAFVADVRRRLSLLSGQYLHDKYGQQLDFHDLFMFNFWMQQQLVVLKAKRYSLSPVCRVGRTHIRLDTKILVQLALRCCPNNPSVVHMTTLAATADGPTNHPDVLLPPQPKPPRPAACGARGAGRLRQAQHQGGQGRRRQGPVPSRRRREGQAPESAAARCCRQTEGGERAVGQGRRADRARRQADAVDRAGRLAFHQNHEKAGDQGLPGSGRRRQGRDQGLRPSRPRQADAGEAVDAPWVRRGEGRRRPRRGGRGLARRRLDRQGKRALPRP